MSSSRSRTHAAPRGDPYKANVTEIPKDLNLKTSEVYLQAYEPITGKTFEFPADEPVLQRIRRNLAKYMKG